jgi:PKD repeat protein
MVLIVVPVSAAWMEKRWNEVDWGEDNLGTATAMDEAQCRIACMQNTNCMLAEWQIAGHPDFTSNPIGICWLTSTYGKSGLVPKNDYNTYINHHVPPHADFSANPMSGNAPLTVRFTDQSSDFEPGITKLSWNWGDGNPPVTTLTGSVQTHTYQLDDTYTVSLTAQDWGGSNTKTMTITVKKLQPTTGTLTVYTTPSGATVYVDLIYQGTTPLTIPHLAPGSHPVRLTLTGYTEYSGPVIITSDQIYPLNIQLTQSESPSTTGSLAVTSTPSGASITVDSVAKGTTPKTITDLSKGSHTVKLTKSGYWDSSQTVTIGAGKTTPMDVSLVLSSQPTLSETSATPTPYQPVGVGSIIVTSSPSGANVYLDGQSSGKTPLTIQNVNPGTHTILLTMQGYSDTSKTVEVTAGSQNQVSVDLVGGKKTPGFEAALVVFSITGLVAFRMRCRKEE